jgi:hypothetical protein
MGNPFDPNVPLYDGQVLRAQPQAQAQNQAAGLHFLAGIGELVMAGAHFMGAGDDDEEGEEEESSSRRSVRPRLFGARPSARVGKGSCCRRPVGR